MLDRIAERTGGAGLERYEVSAYRAAGPPLPPQPQLLAVRRLPRHRRRRARQDELPAPRRAPGALARPGRATWRGARGRRGGRAGRRGRARRAAVRVHAQRAAPAATASSSRASASAPACRSSAIERPLDEAERRGLIERDLQRVRPTRARLRLPERPAAAVPAARAAERAPRVLQRHAGARAFAALEQSRAARRGARRQTRC